jgi:hypothetical protein
LNDEAVRVTGDLKVGDRIVALGAHLLCEGDVVRVADELETSLASGRRGQL